MRKLLITVVVLGALAAGYVFLSTRQLTFTALQGKTEKVHRGDLVVPINASGNIKPASVTSIKSKASGEVKEIPFEVGQMVKKGDIVVQLDTVDEQNSVDKAQAELNRATIALNSAKISRRQKKDAVLPSMHAKLDSAKARAKRTELLFKYKTELMGRHDPSGRAVATTQEYNEAETADLDAQATVHAAEAEIKNVEIGIDMADQDIMTAEEAVNSAQNVLDDAKQRLKECTIYSPIDGMILTRNVQKGEVIQGGRTTFTGGTVLMEIADVGEIYAVVNVDEADIGQVRQLAPRSARPGATSEPATLPEGVIEIGEPVEVTVESFKDEKFKGQIERISPQSEIVAAIATFKVWIRIKSENRDKLVGLLNTQAEAHFTAKSVRNALLVSYDAIQKDPSGEDYGVYIPVRVPPKDQIEPRFKKCKFGVDNGIDVEVKEGLSEGDEVYVKLPQKTQKEKDADEKGEKK